MVVACDNCSAKYNLEESKIPERGARITCKKCMHVFRVYPSTRAPEEEVEVDFSSFDSDKQDIPLTPPPPKEPASPPAESPAVATEPTENNAEVDTAAEDVTGMDVYTLDFQKVGLKFWKVKIKIGFTYDFSDFKTFVKSLREGRINDTDLLSYDGKTWIPINEIDDLEVFFCQLYKKLEKSSTQPEDVKPKVKTSAGPDSTGPSNINDLASAIADAEAEVNTAFSPVSSPVAQSRSSVSSHSRNRPIRKKRTPVPPPTKSSFPLGIVAAVVVALVGGGLWFSTTLEENSSSAKARTNHNQKTVLKKYKEKQEKDALAAAQARMEAEKKKIAAERGIELKEDKPKEIETENLKAVIPQDVLDAQKNTGQNSPSKVKKAVDYAQEGAAAIKSRDYKKAAKAYAQAAKSKPRGEYFERQGYSLYKQGNTDAAVLLLKKAGSMGYKRAYKLLGEIYRDEYGDDAGAQEFFDKAK